MEVQRTIKGAGDLKNGVDRQLLRDVAYEKLKTAIQLGELKPGDPLYEVQLSEMLHISRTPVREALQQLVLEGLVKNMPNRAMTVASLSMQDALNVLHVRYLIEPEVVRLVAESASPEIIDQLMSALEAMEKAVELEDRTEWARADMVYHETISQACPNKLLGELGLQMRNRVHLLATDSQTSTQRLKACTQEHREVVEAIAQKDGTTAQEAMKQHLQLVRESYFRRLSHM